MNSRQELDECASNVTINACRATASHFPNLVVSCNLVPSPNLNDVKCWRGKSKNRSWRKLFPLMYLSTIFNCSVSAAVGLATMVDRRHLAEGGSSGCTSAVQFGLVHTQIPHVVRLWDGLLLVCQDHEVAGPRDSTVSPASMSIPTPNFLARNVVLVQECHALTCRRLPLSCVPSAASSLYHP